VRELSVYSDVLPESMVLPFLFYFALAVIATHKKMKNE
jgi:hypothetical protein